ncbi:MAG: hypothetical protein WEA10_06755 [Actinomycetota bacterium]
MSDPQDTLDRYAESLRDSGADAALRFADEWRAKAERAIEYLIRTGTDFSSDDIRRIAGDPPTPNALGAVFVNASKAGRIELVEYRRSQRLGRHAARVGVWRGARGGR